MSENKNESWEDILDELKSEMSSELSDLELEYSPELEEPPEEAITEGDTFQIDERYFSSDAEDFGTTSVLPDGLGDISAYTNGEASTAYEGFALDEDFVGADAEEAYDIYEEEEEPRRRRKDADQRIFSVRRRRRTGLMGGLMYAAFILSVASIIAFMGWMLADDVLGLTVEDFVAEVTIPEDFTIEDVAEVLYEQGLIQHQWLFRMVAGLFSYYDRIQPGVYHVSSADYRAMIGSMNQRTGALIEVNVTLIEGLMNRQIFNLLEDNGVAAAEALQYVADNIAFDEFEFLADLPMTTMNRLEGYLFPDTYTFFRGQNPESVIRTMLRNFNVRMNQNEVYDLVEESPFTLHEILNIASMIERETASIAEMPRISSVIWNRINQGWHLNIDATIQYLLDAPMEFLTTTVINQHSESPYNTYRVIGLPYGPIANPGMAAILAALRPESTNFMFYALHIDGDHHVFTLNYDQHRAFMNTPEFAHFGVFD